MSEIKRKGSRSIKDIPEEVLKQLNRGEIESANLVEFLGIDRKELIEYLLIQHGRQQYIQPIRNELGKLKKLTSITINEAIAKALFEQITVHHDGELLRIFSSHPSDIVRCWATNLIGKNEHRSIRELLDDIRPFAADKHFNVRECAWADVKKRIARDLSESLAILSIWATDKDENIRRFASEATRPRGVWCEHIVELKQNPGLGLPILEPLKSDQSKYVRDSVGNWLNDAAKSQPQFVTELCKRWGNESDTKETKYIIKKALRSFDK